MNLQSLKKTGFLIIAIMCSYTSARADGLKGLSGLVPLAYVILTLCIIPAQLVFIFLALRKHWLARMIAALGAIGSFFWIINFARYFKGNDEPAVIKRYNEAENVPDKSPGFFGFITEHFDASINALIVIIGILSAGIIIALIHSIYKPMKSSGNIA